MRVISVCTCDKELITRSPTQAFHSRTFRMYYIMYVMRIHNITGFNSTTISAFLTRAELLRKGSQVTLRCEFADEYPDASCVLVYREYNNLYLILKEYGRSTEFPVTIPVKDAEKYTFAVFGKNGKKIENVPVLLLKKEEHITYPPQTCKNLYPSAVSSSHKCTVLHELWADGWTVILWVIEYIRTPS